MQILSRFSRAAALAAALLFVAVARLAARDFMLVAYNVENLFDVDGIANYDDYKPDKYGPAQLATKVTNAGSLLARFNGGVGPDILVVDEIEIDFTPGANKPDYDALLKKYTGTNVKQMLAGNPSAEVRDLPAEFFLLKALNDAGAGPYHLVIGADTSNPDERPSTVKVAIFSKFPIVETRSYPTQSARDILEAKLDVDGAPLYVFGNHWKSGASDPKTEPTRVQNAGVLKARVDRILSADPHADIIIAGDLNSQYNQSARYPAMGETGINTVLGSQGNELAIRGDDRPFYNLWYELPPAARASDLYRDEWGTLIHIIVSRGLYDFRGVQYIDNSFGVAKVAGVNADAAGRPFRWSNEGNGSGYSDHFPIFARFTTVTDNEPNRWMPLRGPASTEDAVAVVQHIDYTAVDLTKSALTSSDIPAGANLQDGSWNRKIFRVDGKVVGERPFTIEFHGQKWEVFSYDKALRTEFYKSHNIGDRVRFYGELGNYKGRWQFLIMDRAWLK